MCNQQNSKIDYNIYADCFSVHALISLGVWVLTVHGVLITGGACHTGQAGLAGVTGLGGP